MLSVIAFERSSGQRNHSILFGHNSLPVHQWSINRCSFALLSCVNTPRLQDNCIKKNEIYRLFSRDLKSMFFRSVLVFQKWIDSACSKAHMWMSASIINSIPEGLGETIQPRCIPGFCHWTQCLCLTRLQCPTSLCSWSGYFGRLQALTPWSQMQSKISFSSNMWTVPGRFVGYLAKSSFWKKGGNSEVFLGRLGEAAEELMVRVWDRMHYFFRYDIIIVNHSHSYSNLANGNPKVWAASSPELVSFKGRTNVAIAQPNNGDESHVGDDSGMIASRCNPKKKSIHLFTPKKPCFLFLLPQESYGLRW